MLLAERSSGRRTSFLLEGVRDKLSGDVVELVYTYVTSFHNGEYTTFNPPRGLALVNKENIF